MRCAVLVKQSEGSFGEYAPYLFTRPYRCQGDQRRSVATYLGSH